MAESWLASSLGGTDMTGGGVLEASPGVTQLGVILPPSLQGAEHPPGLLETGVSGGEGGQGVKSQSGKV